MDKSLGWSPFFMQQLKLDELELELVPVRVVAMHRSGLVVSDGSTEDNVALGSNWYRLDVEERPIVGDWVLVNAERDKVERLLERKSCFRRLASGDRVEMQLIAANVDTLFIVTSCNHEFNESRLERYLALAFESTVTPVVVLTKADLTDTPDAYGARAQSVAKGVAVEVVNALDVKTLDGVRAWIGVGQTAALVGSSGVGKSTLLNTLSGAAIQETRAIREDDARGRHTTTSRSLHLLEGGGLLLDVPGLRELAVGDASAGVRETFDEVEMLAQHCRFADCQHGAEPGCAVREALASGELDERRLNNYFKLLREERRHSESLAERHQRSRDWAKGVRARLREQAEQGQGMRGTKYTK